MFSDDQVENIHATALRVLSELGIRVLDPDARAMLVADGATLHGDDLLRFDADRIEALVALAPRHFELYGADDRRSVSIGGKHLAFLPVGGPPNVSDRIRGRRPGTLADLSELVRLAQSFDVIHALGPSVEPQDVDLAIRHLRTTEVLLTQSDKAPFVFARGDDQVRDCLEMVRLARGLDARTMSERPVCYTVINTNSPRQLDVAMCRGIIQFARAGQVVIVTPFTLSGAMAPVTIAGALALQHAEALAGIALAQLARPGAPVVYGAFTPNVDMKSGSPAFGTPEFVKGALGAGQLARRLGLPWRGSSPTAANAPDAQASSETLMSAWGSLLGGVNVMLHSAGWLEGGLTASLEKFILDIEALQIFAELCHPLPASDDDIGFGAIRDVAPGGHFFSVQHTLERYATAFHVPLVADWRNHGQWTEAGARRADERATDIWQATLERFEAPGLSSDRAAALTCFVERRVIEGGARPI